MPLQPEDAVATDYAHSRKRGGVTRFKQAIAQEAERAKPVPQVVPPDMKPSVADCSCGESKTGMRKEVIAWAEVHAMLVHGGKAEIRG